MAARSNSYYSILKGLLNDGKFRQSQPLLCTLVRKHGLIDEPKVCDILMHYLCLKNITSALRFRSNVERNNVNWGRIISFPVCGLHSLTRDGRVLDAYRLIMGFAPYKLPVMTVVDYSIVIDGLCKAGHLVKALNLCTLAANEGVTLNIVTHNSVMSALCREGCLIDAFRLFDSLERIRFIPSDITYGLLIDNLCKEGYLFDANKLFERMVSKGYKLNTRIYNSFINGYCKCGQIDEALKILTRMQVECLDSDEFTVSALINGYCMKGDMEGALRIFSFYKDSGVSPDFLGFLYLIRGLFTKGRMEEARSILREMLQSQSVIDMITKASNEVEMESIESFLSSLCEQGSIREAIIVLNEIASLFFPVHKWYGHYNKSQYLDISYQKNTDMNSATDDDVMEPDSLVTNSDDMGENAQPFFNSYYAMLASLCAKGKVERANRLAKEMLVNLGRDY